MSAEILSDPSDINPGVFSSTREGDWKKAAQESLEIGAKTQIDHHSRNPLAGLSRAEIAARHRDALEALRRQKQQRYQGPQRRDLYLAPSKEE